jgi:fumarate reductase subunit C
MQRLSAGPAAWQGFLQALRSADSIVFHLLAMVAAFYHAGTWFNATQKAMPLQIGEDFVPGNLHFGRALCGWAALSVVVLFLAGVF